MKRPAGFNKWFKRTSKLVKEEIGMDVLDYYYHQHMEFYIPDWEGAYMYGRTEVEAIKDLIGDIWSKKWKMYLAAELHGY